MSYGFSGVLAGAYLRTRRRRFTFLIHVVERREDGTVVRALCGRVKPENLSDDIFAPGALGPATCSTCRRLARGVKPGTPLGDIIRRDTP